ncbi:MAG: hypothetical protein K2G25_01665, partial [Oscillospiraceae bacterium]|nr:hypothetical protein [Oscillospiraceae bacterium]
MYPMDYEEFLWALEDTTTFPMMKYAYENRRALGDAVHRQFMRKFRLYMLIGGMPQAINAYLDTNDLRQVDDVKNEIIELYIDDIRELDESGRASRIFESIPGELAKSKLRYTVGSVIENADAYNLNAVWEDLESLLTINISYKCSIFISRQYFHCRRLYFKWKINPFECSCEVIKNNNRIFFCCLIYVIFFIRIAKYKSLTRC